MYIKVLTPHIKVYLPHESNFSPPNHHHFIAEQTFPTIFGSQVRPSTIATSVIDGKFKAPSPSCEQYQPREVMTGLPPFFSQRRNSGRMPSQSALCISA